MSLFLVNPIPSVKGEIRLPGDKSIACRSIIISAISRGQTAIENFPPNKDCLSAVKTFKSLGVRITHNRKARKVNVFGNGLYGLKKPKGPVYTGDSGTTLRLTLGVLSGQKFPVKLTAGKSLTRRPMLRVTEPLRRMGARIKSRVDRSFICSGKQDKLRIEEYPPIIIKGGSLKPVTYKMPVASAQVKSALLLAGLYAKGKTCIIEPVKTRDHTERMLKFFKGEIKVKQNKIVVNGARELISPDRLFIPGDISSASFFLVLGTILPNSRILIRNVCLNPSRTGIIKVLKRMGAHIHIKTQNPESAGYEPVGDVFVRSAYLKGTTVKKEEIPSLIDELPILMVAASFARGKSAFKGVTELRVKETDRIRSMHENLRNMGADIRIVKYQESEDIIITGGEPLKGATVKTFQDHRTAMSMVIAGLAAGGKTYIDSIACVNKSFPNFLSLLKGIIH